MVSDVSPAPVPPGAPEMGATLSPAAPPRRARSLLFSVLGLCLLFHIVLQWILWPVRVDGQSMAPNYDDGQPTIINRFAYLTHPPQRGDVVGLRVGDEFYLKRIIGLPGERIEFVRDTVLVNGRPLKEWYPVTPLLWNLAPAQLGENDYYVMGDNRSQSKLGPVSRDRIIGKAIY
jgi:signal peptidase I